ncbi:MAG: hypothetical protein HY812_07860 [Planctomycetes bacterium]|nr:hypothetical protein [Planctomycetota bacterium]
MKRVVLSLVVPVVLVGAAKVTIDHCLGDLHGAQDEGAVASQPNRPGLADRVATNEAAARAALLLYHSAQQAYRAEHGRFAKELVDLDLPAAIQHARLNDLGVFAPEGYCGYYFEPVLKDGARRMDHEADYVLCAIPLLYPYTGRTTFAIRADGVILEKDTEGLPVLETAEFQKGWRQS